MSFMTALELAASGLRTSRVRLNVVAGNIANAQTTRTPEGGPYRRRDVVLTTTALPTSFQRLLGGRVAAGLRGVEVAAVRADPSPPRTVYDPGHPDADARGMVKLPNINMVEEMVDMIAASRAFEAGVTTMQTIKAMADKALSIGR